MPRAGSVTAALRAGLRFAFARIARIYFRDIEVAGDVPTHDTGGRLFAANHVNALVDPILVLTQAPCPISPIAKSTLWNIPGLRWILDAADAVPIVRRRDDPTKREGENDAVFTRVASHLEGGGNILIFPEGTSHNEPHLLVLRSGAGRMLARARAEAREAPASSPLTFQAVALEFDERDVFRSRCLVLFGPVRRVDDLAEDGAGDDELAKRVTERLREDLRELLVEAESWETRVLVIRVAEMFANEATLATRNALGRQVEAARETLRRAAPDVATSIEAEVSDYFAELEALGLVDADVADAGGTGAAERRARATLATALTVLAAPLAALGFVLYALPYQLPRLVTKRLGGEGDVASTYKLGVGLVAFPVWAMALLALAFALLPAPLAAVAALAVLASPFAALPWVDRLDEVGARAGLLGPREVARDRAAALASRRAALIARLDEARARAEAASPQVA